MERASNAKVEDIYITAHDGTILILRKVWGGRQRAVLLLPRHGGRISDERYDDLAHAIADASTTCYLLEPRGHGISEGEWSLHNHRVDLAHVLEMLHKAFPSVYVIAHDWSAGLMLEREHHGVDGMVLIEPRKSASTDDPGAHQRVRMQTPTIIFSSHVRTLLERVTGPVHVRAAWHTPKSSTEQTQQSLMLKGALQELMAHEKPIRFSTQR